MFIFKSNGVGQPVSFHDSMRGAKVGRWCKPPLYPDRCECYDPKAMLHKTATHYTRERGYRFGACIACATNYQHKGKLLREIPKG